MFDCRLQRLKRATLHAIIFLMLPLSLSAGANEAEIPDNVTQLRQLAQLAEYIGVDYAEAVKNGQVINNNEYLLQGLLAQILSVWILSTINS